MLFSDFLVTFNALAVLLVTTFSAIHLKSYLKHSMGF